MIPSPEQLEIYNKMREELNEISQTIDKRLLKHIKNMLNVAEEFKNKLYNDTTIDDKVTLDDITDILVTAKRQVQNPEGLTPQVMSETKKSFEKLKTLDKNSKCESIFKKAVGGLLMLIGAAVGIIGTIIAIKLLWPLIGSPQVLNEAPFILHLS